MFIKKQTEIILTRKDAGDNKKPNLKILQIYFSHTL